MLRAMIVGSDCWAEAAGANAVIPNAIAPTAIHSRVPRIPTLLSPALVPERGADATRSS
jgi:hypothetical protein